MAVSEWSGASLPWFEKLAGLKERIGGLFRRKEPRRRIGLYLEGLIGGVERKNDWQLAETCGRPGAMADASAAWADPMGSREGARQYSGTAGRIENCQVGVFLSYAGPKGHGLIDRRLYLPKDWAEDQDRRRTASIPETQAFLTKPRIGQSLAKDWHSDDRRRRSMPACRAPGCQANRFTAATRACGSWLGEAREALCPGHSRQREAGDEPLSHARRGRSCRKPRGKRMAAPACWRRIERPKAL